MAPSTLAADAVVVVHFAWILFLIGGWLIGRSVRWVKWAHLLGLGYSVLLQVFSWTCPLTYLEVWLRARQPFDLYAPKSFIGSYVEPIVYMEFSRPLLFVATGVVIAVSLVTYAVVPRRARAMNSAAGR